MLERTVEREVWSKEGGVGINLHREEGMIEKGMVVQFIGVIRV